VLEEVRGLDQDARAALRRHGVRFGAHHIYIPALLKPAPSTLLATLWALKHRELDLPGLAELSAISGSGRTSISVDQNFDPQLYGRFGFRVYGNRAVRIDILERLADLIRPALAWNAATPGERPAEAAPEGRGFVVTAPMTSLLGASGDDMAVILQGLGYRMERRQKPVEPTPAVAEAAPQIETKASEPGHPAPEKPPVEEPPVEEPKIEPPAKEPPGEEPPLEEPPQEEPPAEEPPPEAPPAQEPMMPPSAAADAETLPQVASTEPEMIEVWRPDFARGRHDARKERQPGQRRRSQRSSDGEESRRRSGDGEEARRRQGKPSHQKRERRPQPERDRAQRPERSPRPPRERPIDPDSPFAALAALKQSLEKSERE
jgi:ATP-dependent RNA helicase SUPV3L1/SUV3